MIFGLWLAGVLLSAFGTGYYGEDADDFHPGMYTFLVAAWPLVLFALGLRVLNAIGLGFYNRRET